MWDWFSELSGINQAPQKVYFSLKEVLDEMAGEREWLMLAVTDLRQILASPFKQFELWFKLHSLTKGEAARHKLVLWMAYGRDGQHGALASGLRGLEQGLALE
jgi:hypothetical protein